MAMSVRLVNLTTLFLGRLTPTSKLLTSTQCTFSRQCLTIALHASEEGERMYHRKYFILRIVNVHMFAEYTKCPFRWKKGHYVNGKQENT